MSSVVSTGSVSTGMSQTRVSGKYEGDDKSFCILVLLCWVAIDRALRLARKRSFPAPVARWHEVRDEIYRDIFAHFWDAERQAFQAGPRLDRTRLFGLAHAACQVHFADRSRWVSTLRAIERKLVSDSLVYRYRLGDGFSDGLRATKERSVCAPSGTWSASHGWGISSRPLLLRKNAWLCEPCGPLRRGTWPLGEHLGNFPQAFTHLALISAAYDLDRRLSVAGHPG